MTDINKHIEQLNWQREPFALYEPIQYTLASGGKRLRPMLAITAADIFGGQAEQVMPAALALEIFHNFTLLHDDLMDRAEVRRGQPTVHVRWGDNTAILSGDQMLIEAYKQLEQIHPAFLPQVFKWFNEMATAVCEGQQYDMIFEYRTQVSVDEYINMIGLKTAALLAYALRIGAYMGGANEEQQEALYQFGRHIGLAFQIQDDILDVYGDPKTFGKAIGGDICCNKKTLMLLTALESANAEDKAELLQWLMATGRNEEKIAAVTDIYTRLGVRASCEVILEQHTALALQQLDLLPQNKTTDQLRDLAERLATRKK